MKDLADKLQLSDGLAGFPVSHSPSKSLCGGDKGSPQSALRWAYYRGDAQARAREFDIQSVSHENEVM